MAISVEDGVGGGGDLIGVVLELVVGDAPQIKGLVTTR